MFDFLHPHLLVDKLSKDIKPHREHQAQQEKDDSLRQVEDVENRINPDISFVFDNVYPAEISGHEDCKSGKTHFAARVVTE